MIAAQQIAFGKAAGGEPAPAYWGLCFTAEEDGSTVAMEAVGSAPAVSLLYSTDGTNWDDFIVGTTMVTLANVGDKVYIKAGAGGNITLSTNNTRYNRFVMRGSIAASGNVMSLLVGEQETTEFPDLSKTNIFRRLFQQCTALTTAPSLPATTLAASCYALMFSGCTSLTTAPSLPATTLAASCYISIFSNCTSLTTAPSLPATTLTASCYRQMFQYCAALTTAPSLPATTLAASCYASMFSDCSNLTEIKVAFSAWNPTNATLNWMTNAGSAVSTTKTFRCPTALGTDATITRGVSACPEGWTVINTD